MCVRWLHLGMSSSVDRESNVNDTHTHTHTHKYTYIKKATYQLVDQRLSGTKSYISLKTNVFPNIY